MNAEPDDLALDAPPALVEGTARVVALDGDTVWLEPEPRSGCGTCASAGMCGAKGIGTAANRIEARRFPLHDHLGLTVGERVVVGVPENALLKATGAVYAVPLAAALGAGAVAQWAAGSDGVTLAAMIAGLALGMLVARLGAGRLGTRGNLAPRLLRRAAPGETCERD
jgi:sigma-E factor negative regulatory protein RseC